MEIAPDVLRHRLVLTYDALADSVDADDVIVRVLQTVGLLQVVAAPVAPERRPAAWRAWPDPAILNPPAGCRTAEQCPACRAVTPRCRPSTTGCLKDPALTAALRNLELTVRRKLDGVLQGAHLRPDPRAGLRAGEARAYQPGDDIRRMEWAVTARTTVPHVRQMIADRELETWLVVDVSGSLDFGTVGHSKRDLAVAAAAIIVHLTAGGGNRIGAVIVTGDEIVDPGPGWARACAEPLKKIATTHRSSPTVRGDLRDGIEALRRPERRRGLAVVISDFLGPIGLGSAAARHRCPP